MIHIFYGWTQDCLRVAEELGITNPWIIRFPEDLKGLRGDITEHICRPAAVAPGIIDERQRLHACANVTTIHHHHRNEKGPSMAPGPGQPHPNQRSS